MNVRKYIARRFFVKQFFYSSVLRHTIHLLDLIWTACQQYRCMTAAVSVNFIEMIKIFSYHYSETNPIIEAPG